MISREDFIRPSGLDAAEHCNGNPAMQARAVRLVPAILRITHVVAEQGTMGHVVVAQTLALTYQQPGGWTLADDSLSQMAGAMSKLEPWTRDAVRRCVAYAVALIDQAVQQEYEVTLQIEMKLSGATVAIGRGGTADLIILCRRPGEAVIRWVIVSDWKLGFLDQGHAADHLQLGTYAVMAYDKYKPEMGVTVHLAQGRRQEFSSAHYTPEQIAALRPRIIGVVRAAWADEPPLNPCIAACRYCKAITHCRAVRERIMHAAEEKALFGDEVIDRIKMNEDGALARRFAEEVKALQKQWQAEAQGAAVKS